MTRAWFTVLLLCGTAGALSLGGSVVGDLPAKARVGAWLLGASGRALGEVASAPLKSGRFELNVPDAPPSGPALWPLRPDALTWPGLSGNVKVSGATQAGELRLFLYGDANGDGQRDESEAVTELRPQLGKAAVTLVFAEKAVTVTAARGFEARLQGGWNVVSIALGKTSKVSVTRGAADLTLTPR